MPGQSTTPSQRVPSPSTPADQNPAPARNSTTTRGTFSSIDEDGDGRISRTEAASSSDDALGRGFSQADSNGDGYVDNDEYARSRNSPGPARP
jgi:Ca2+-binding EF-hand superfamily protein